MLEEGKRAAAPAKISHTFDEKACRLLWIQGGFNVTEWIRNITGINCGICLVQTRFAE